MKFLKGLDWSQNWFWYGLIAIIIVVISVLLIKNLLSNIKKIIRLIIVVLLVILILYILHLAGVINFDVFKMIGLEKLSIAIKNFVSYKGPSTPTKSLILLNSII